MWQYTAGWPPHYLNLLNHSWPSDCLVVSHISSQGYFTFLYGHKKHNIHNREGGRKENKQTQTWISFKRKKREVCDTFLAFYELSQVCIQSEILTKGSGMLTHPFTLANPPSGSTDPSSCSLLPTVVFCRLLLTALGPSFPHLLPVSWKISRAISLSWFRTKTDKGIIWMAFTHTHTDTTNFQHRVTLYRHIQQRLMIRRTILIETVTANNDILVFFLVHSRCCLCHWQYSAELFSSTNQTGQ